MSWIREIDEEEATEELKAVYDRIKRNRGKVANIMKVHSLNPKSMLAHQDLYLNLMFSRSGLSREEREMMGVLISGLNGCEYCRLHHAEALNHYWKNEAKTNEFMEDFRSIMLGDRGRAMLEYAEKLTKDPESIGKGDVDSLIAAGFNDEDVLNINLIASYFNFVNRIALGLGVEYTAEETRGYKNDVQ
ncbi:MAG: hypothetical protein AYK23_04155 [Candidatus Proteinoplasmatales archaeon SG8-5]|nr:MAG: hypothetical protein AYK23_04155 [Candidatus Proteinoplasmatales archaeon SG8-5]